MKTIDELIAASSLGDPEALAVRAEADPAVVERVLARADELDRKTDRHASLMRNSAFPKRLPSHTTVSVADAKRILGVSSGVATAIMRVLTAAQLDAIRECMHQHQGLSAASIVWVLVPELRDFADGMAGGVGLGSYPLDPDDFSRCRRILALIPDGAERVAGGAMAVAFPKVGAWARLGACWPELEALWLEEEKRPDRRMPRLYARMAKAEKGRAR